MLNVSINGGVSASPQPTLKVVEAHAAFDNGLSWSAQNQFYVTSLTTPEDILADWPVSLTSERHVAMQDSCKTALAARAQSTVFHFEAHQTVLGPEYFGALQTLADLVTACPGIALKLQAAGVAGTQGRQRVASVLHVLERRGYDLTQFKVDAEPGDPAISQRSEADPEQAYGRIEFALVHIQ